MSAESLAVLLMRLFDLVSSGAAERVFGGLITATHTTWLRGAKVARTLDGTNEIIVKLHGGRRLRIRIDEPSLAH